MDFLYLPVLHVAPARDSDLLIITVSGRKQKKSAEKQKEAIESRASVELIVWVLDKMLYVYLIFFFSYYYYFFNATHGMLAEKMKKITHKILVSISIFAHKLARENEHKVQSVHR